MHPHPTPRNPTTSSTDELIARANAVRHTLDEATRELHQLTLDLREALKEEEDRDRF